MYVQVGVFLTAILMTTLNTYILLQYLCIIIMKINTNTKTNLESEIIMKLYKAILFCEPLVKNDSVFMRKIEKYG